MYSAPECCSYTFNEEGKVTSFTGGYVIDRRVGNTGERGFYIVLFFPFFFPSFSVEEFH